MRRRLTKGRALVVFDVPGPAKGKGRPRSARTAGGVRLYTPTATERYEKKIAVCALEVFGGPVQWTGVELWVDVFTRREPWLVLRPDVDNVLKIVMDGLRGVVYDDDGHVIRATVRRRRWTKPGIRVKVIGAAA